MNKFFFIAIFIIAGLTLGIKLCYDNTNLFHRYAEFDKSEPLSQTELDKTELLSQKSVENMILIINENMDNIIVDSVVDNNLIVIQLNVAALEQEKIDNIISYVSKSSNTFAEKDIVIKNNNLEIIHP